MRGRLPDPARQSLASNARLLSGQTIEGKKGPAHVRGRRGVLAFRDQVLGLSIAVLKASLPPLGMVLDPNSPLRSAEFRIGSKDMARGPKSLIHCIRLEPSAKGSPRANPWR